jgi:hypothetical protein
VQTLLQEIVAAWREAERMAQEAAPGSQARAAAQAAADRLKALAADVEAAARLGVGDRDDFRAMFDEARVDPGVRLPPEPA